MKRYYVNNLNGFANEKTYVSVGNGNTKAMAFLENNGFKRTTKREMDDDIS